MVQIKKAGLLTLSASLILTGCMASAKDDHEEGDKQQPKQDYIDMRDVEREVAEMQPKLIAKAYEEKWEQEAKEQAEKEAKDKLEQEAQTIIDEGKEEIEEVIEPENNSYTEESSTAAESTDTDSNYDSSDDDSDTPNDLVPITPFELPDDYIYTY